MMLTMLQFYMYNSPHLSVDITELFPSGCYCDFDTHGHGKPVSSLDKACFHWKQCLHCADIDTLHNCSPTHTYTIDFSTQEHVFTCNAAKNDLCGQLRCSCDLNLVNSIHRHLVEWEATTSVQNGFNPVNGCPAQNSPHVPKDKCCGVYPKRVPFAQKSFGRLGSSKVRVSKIVDVFISWFSY